MADIGIGSTIWRFDVNRRVYTKPEKGGFFGRIVYREHWVPVKITGETKRSWVVESAWKAEKAPKKGKHHGWAFTQQEVDDDVYAHDHAYRISQLVLHGDPSVLRAVADLIGYKGEA